MSTRAPKGTADLLPADMRAWEAMKEVAVTLFSRYGYQMVETPTFEHTDVLVHGIGEATDVVGKEMFQVLSTGASQALAEGKDLDQGQRLSLRPEGTAGVVRAAVEHNLVPQGAAPVKLMYAGSMYRAENPQKGRLREFHQIGVECLGASEPTSDAEVIIMLMSFYEALGIPRSSLRLLINSMGDDACRPAYRETIRSYILQHADELCDDCKRRAETNPLRAFDCKNEGCRQVMEAAPKLADGLCDDCREHYEAVKRYLDAAGISYIEDPRLVRGLDYYTRTVFEVQADCGLGSQNAIGGGGRYDKLMEVSGGQPTPGLGWALGFERTRLVCEELGIQLGKAPSRPVFVACVDASCRDAAFSLMQEMRAAGIKAEMSHQPRSLKSQFKLADKLDSVVTVILGPDELAQGQATVRSMDTHGQESCDLDKVAGAVQALLGQETIEG